MKKIVLITLTMFFELCLSRVNYAYQASTFEKFESSSSSGYSEIKNRVYLNQLMDLQNINVKFSQDDTYYIFQVTGNASINIFKDVDRAPYTELASSIVPLLYKKQNFGSGMYIYEADKMPFASFTSGNIYTEAAVSILGVSIEQNKFSYRLHSSGNITDQNNVLNGNGDKYFIGNKMRFFGEGNTLNFSRNSDYPYLVANDGLGVKLLQNSSHYYYTYNSTLKDGYNCVDMYYSFINAKIAIEKQYIDDYRYICFGQSYTVRTSRSATATNERHTGISICSQTIDLKEYVYCEHDWEMRKDDRISHSIYCKNCEWTKTEPHNLLYEYDGIKHNVCTCSYIEKVKYYFNINDDYTDEVVEEFETDADYIKVEFQKKTGYKFKHYNVYEKLFVSTNLLSTNSNALKTVFVATCSTLPEKTGQVSKIYEAKYEANKFKIVYSNINNKNLNIYGNIEPQIITYDEEAFLRKNIKCEGYFFDGWSTSEGGETIDLKPQQEVTNYSDIDLYELTLYPVYNNLNFSIAYSAGSGHFEDGSKYREVKYTYHDNTELERVLTGSSELYMFGYTDDVGNKFFTMDDVKKFIDEKGINNVTLNLFPMFGRAEYGSPERSDDDVGPGDNGGKKDKKNGDDDNNGDTDNNLDGQNDNIIDDGAMLREDIIHGMSDTKDNPGGEIEYTGEITATLSFIMRKNQGNSASLNKLDRLLLFIRNNFLLCSAICTLLIILLIIYEILVINYYLKLKNYVNSND